MHRFLHIGFAFPGPPKMRDLEPVLSTLGDWVRYSATSWILWTDKPTTELFLRIKPHLDAADQFLIAKIDPDDSIGWLSPWIWTWMRSKGVQVVQGNALAQLLIGGPKG
jgi:hypothetical protein